MGGFKLENVQVTLHSLKIMEPRPIVFKEWRDTEITDDLFKFHVYFY